MIQLLYLDTPRINRRVNVAAHFRTLKSMAERAGIPVGSEVVFLAEEARRHMQASTAGVLYLLGHSEGTGGMVLSGRPALDGRTLAAWLPRRAERLPRVALFNTCDAVSSGLVRAALAAGIATVVAAPAPIPIDAMCTHSETLFRAWLESGASLTEAVRLANATFAHQGMLLEVHGGEQNARP
ncbi:MAG: hypothetical protein IPK82_27525 [Polyangiaceae bacterium]|nr:hypothetical protein [Polyangiaceae bacterium]